MKTRIAILTMLFGLFITTSAFSAEPLPRKELATKAVAKVLENEITYPAFASERNLECTVFVDLTVNKDGTLKVNGANCKADCMKEYCIKAIEEAKSNDLKEFAGENVIIRIDYKLYE